MRHECAALAAVAEKPVHEALARALARPFRLVAFKLGSKLLHELPRLGREPGRADDAQSDMQVAAPRAAQMRHALAAQAQHLAGLRARGHREFDGAVERLELDCRSKHCLRN